MSKIILRLIFLGFWWVYVFPFPTNNYRPVNPGAKLPWPLQLWHHGQWRITWEPAIFQLRLLFHTYYRLLSGIHIFFEYSRGAYNDGPGLISPRPLSHIAHIGFQLGCGKPSQLSIWTLDLGDTCLHVTCYGTRRRNQTVNQWSLEAVTASVRVVTTSW